MNPNCAIHSCIPASPKQYFSGGKQFGFASLYVDKHISYCRQRSWL